MIAAATAALLEGAVWYSPLLFGEAWTTLRGMDPGAMANPKIPIGEMIAEFARALVVAYVLARFVVLFGVVDWKGAVQIGIWVWVGFQATAVMGAVIHENYPWALYAIHAGDALVKTLVMAAILGTWPKSKVSPEARSAGDGKEQN
ncbi:DUF1761 domain-containing protein [Bradyrhizobium sp. Leo121]|uniref:DUF1761 domain-containing protein n=1 Tax=Bradyrhizobium sp. Leo121 TaxID=1571195 RepID=UPI001FE10AE0|nr:DUF1761 domain-containing protein [Bradyrhizobium sp. Leo121]